MSFDNNSFYDDNSTKNWQPQPTPMEDRRRRHTGRWITAIVILALLVLTGVGTVHLVRDVGVTLNRSDSGFLLTIGREQPAESAGVQPAAQEQAAAAEGPAPAAQTPVQAQAQAELPQLEISSSPAGVPTSASEDAGGAQPAGDLPPLQRERRVHHQCDPVRQGLRHRHHHVGRRLYHHEPPCDRRRGND